MPTIRIIGEAAAGLVAGFLLLAASVAAAAPAVLAVDARTGRVLVDQGAGRPMNPASLTKLMTAYVAFAEIAAGRLRLDDKLPVSARAASQSGSVLGLRAGETIRLDQALAGLVARSGNDAAVVVAERVSGSEEAFADRMNREAARLGMTASHFRNATGLSVAGHVTTPRDMAVLALALWRDFPQRMGVFAVRRLAWHGRELPTVNAFLVDYPGALGMKTGFTCHAGYNLVAAAGRNGRMALVVVMGAVSRGERAATARRTMDRALGAAEPAAGSVAGLVNLATSPPDMAGPACGGSGGGPGLPMAGSAPGGWGVELAIAFRRDTARRQAGLILGRNPRFAKGNIVVVAQPFDGLVQWRGLALGLAETDAVQGCLALRARESEDACTVLTPAMVGGAFEVQEQLRRAEAME